MSGQAYRTVGRTVPLNTPHAAGGRRGHCIHAPFDRRIVHQRGGVTGLDPRIDHQRPGASPVLAVDEGADALDVGGGIRSGERHPEEVADVPRGEVAVVDDDDEGERPDGVVGAERAAEGQDIPVVVAVRGPVDGQDARQDDARLAEAAGEVEAGRQLAR